VHIIVLGAAAGGGLPQWNCTAGQSAAAWDRQGRVAPATQSSIAVSSNGVHWSLLNASPDLRSQILATPRLHPTNAAGEQLRRSPISEVLITNADVDHIAGLLNLRERQAFELLATPQIHAILAANPIFDVLNPTYVRRTEVSLDTPLRLLSGISIKLFAVPGKVPLFLENADESPQTNLVGEQTIGVELTADGRRALYIPGCADVPDWLVEKIDGSDLLLFDGTVFHDDEMQRCGVGEKTGRRMGHVPIAGIDGSLVRLSGLQIKRRAYVHINNTNPIWDPNSPERQSVEREGWSIAYDGMEIKV